MTRVVACVDYSAGKGEDLVAYRWEGEPMLRDDHFVAYPGEARLDEARRFVRGATWTFAVTMADNPHWYIVVPRHKDSAGRQALLELLEQYSTTRMWHGHAYRAFDVDGWRTG